jgi:hypothetical protein
LSWESVVEECRWFWYVGADGKPVEQLLKIGKPATAELVQALEDPTRAVPAHLTFCSIWGEEAAKNCVGSTDYTYGLPLRYQFGPLRFTSDSRHGKDPVPPEMLSRVKESWLPFLRKAAQPNG